VTVAKYVSVHLNTFPVSKPKRFLVTIPAWLFSPQPAQLSSHPNLQIRYIKKKPSDPQSARCYWSLAATAAIPHAPWTDNSPLSCPPHLYLEEKPPRLPLNPNQMFSTKSVPIRAVVLEAMLRLAGEVGPVVWVGAELGELEAERRNPCDGQW
jgi:hypothetical protein